MDLADCSRKEGKYAEFQPSLPARKGVRLPRAMACLPDLSSIYLTECPGHPRKKIEYWSAQFVPKFNICHVCPLFKLRLKRPLWHAQTARNSFLRPEPCPILRRGNMERIGNQIYRWRVKCYQCTGDLCPTHLCGWLIV